MSAIAGIVRLSPSSVVLTNDLRAMLLAMAVSPSDGIEILASSSGHAAIGRVRYGTDADLPVAAGADAAMRLCMVGELYNEDAGECSAHPSYLLHRYQAGPRPQFARGLNGSFAAAILDEKGAAVTLLTDHMNSCPILVAEHGGLLYFASEAKALTALPHLPCRPNPGMVLSVLTNGQLMNRETVIDGITQLDCAAVHTVGLGGSQAKQVWRFAIDDSAKDLGRNRHIQDLAAVLRKAVARQTRLGSPSILLSGGQDSRTIAAFAPDASGIPAFTYTARSSDERHRFGDAAIAAALARLAGMRHVLLRYEAGKVLQLVRQSVGQSDGAATFLRENVWDLLADEHGVRYVLMGDECFSAVSGPLAESHILEYLGLRRLHECPTLWPYLRPDRLEEFVELSRGQSDRLFHPGSGRPAHNVLTELLHRQRLFFFHNPKRRLIARHGIQVRRPLLDLEVLNWVAALPCRYLVGKAIVHQALRHARPDIARLPRARTTETVSYTGAFADLERQGGQVSAFIFDDNPLLGDYFDIAAVRQLIAEVSTNQAPRRRRRLEGLLPPGVRRWLAAIARRHLHLRSGHLTSRSERLLRIVCVSEVLRHISRRCPPACQASRAGRSY